MSVYVLYIKKTNRARWKMATIMLSETTAQLQAEALQITMRRLGLKEYQVEMLGFSSASVAPSSLTDKEFTRLRGLKEN